MAYVQRWVCIYVAILMIITFTGIGIANGRSSHRHRHRHRRRSFHTNTIVVDKSGQANFTTIQSAINSVPSNNQHWICIHIKAGTYNEQVKIPADKAMIYLLGEGLRTTNVVWGTPLDTYSGATFLSQANNTLVKNLSFTNSYNYPPENNRNPIKMAAAAAISGDKTAFYGCGFFGFQDTLSDNTGRHYFKDCLIEGAVDFIMGAGQSIYEGCTISVRSKSLGGLAGFITAQARESPNDANGFVFKNCNVVGDGPVLLGRAWREYARVIFYHSYLSNIIDPVGWSPWSATGREYQLTYAEDGCRGPGSDTSKRVNWEKKLSPPTLQSLTSMSFIDNDGWISRQPVHS